MHIVIFIGYPSKQHMHTVLQTKLELLNHDHKKTPFNSMNSIIKPPHKGHTTEQCISNLHPTSIPVSILKHKSVQHKITLKPQIATNMTQRRTIKQVPDGEKKRSDSKNSCVYMCILNPSSSAAL